MELVELEHDAAAGRLVCVEARDLLQGHVRVEEEPGHWIRPWRFAASQLRALGSCQAWHPGLFRQMARATAGVRLELVTDASEVVLELSLDEEPTGTRVVLRDVAAWKASQPGGVSGVSATDDALAIEVDDRSWVLPIDEPGTRLVSLPLDDPLVRPLPGVVQLPGMGGSHRVRIWLPALRGCAVRRLWANGTKLEPAPSRPVLLVLGDSLAQGFVTGSPASSWPSLLASRLALSLVNQGLGGQVFQPGTLQGLRGLVDPHAVIVALGANYRYERCADRQVGLDVRAYLNEVARLWPELPTWVVTPTWHDEIASPSHVGSCWARVPAMIADNVATHDEMRLVDGLRLLDADTMLLADGFEHYNADGATQVADRLFVSMRSSAAASPFEMRRRALDVLADAPATTIALREAVRRERAEVVLAEEGCVIARVRDGELLFWAVDLRLATAAAATLIEADTVDLHTPALASELGRRLALTHCEPYHLAYYDAVEPLPIPSDRMIRPLDESCLPTIMERYAHPEWLCENQLRELLAEGRFLGGYEGEELVGFIGEHMVGAIGMLEVFPAYRHKGWAAALESCQINRVLERGDVAWVQVYPSHRASLRLQRSLGLTVTPASEQCFLTSEHDV